MQIKILTFFDDRNILGDPIITEKRSAAITERVKRDASPHNPTDAAYSSQPAATISQIYY